MLIQILINGLILAGNYALIAVGLTLVFGVMRMVNFAQGQSAMIGAFVAFTRRAVASAICRRLRWRCSSTPDSGRSSSARRSGRFAAWS